MIRAFLALPVPETLEATLTIAQHRLPIPRPVPRENFHVTMAFLGDVQEPVLEELHNALELTTLPRVAIELYGFGTFGGNEPDNLHARVKLTPDLETLHARVGKLVRRAGITLEARKFVPHVTLGRFRKFEVLPETLAKALGDYGALRSAPMPAPNLTLYRSTLRHDAPPLYDPLASYPLIG